jgi:hypothetical protein
MNQIDFNDPDLNDKAIRAYRTYTGEVIDRNKADLEERPEILELFKIADRIKLMQNSFTYRDTFTAEEAAEGAKPFWMRKLVLSDGTQHIVDPEFAHKVV